MQLSYVIINAFSRLTTRWKFRNYNCFFGMLTGRQNAFPCLAVRGDIFKVVERLLFRIYFIKQSKNLRRCKNLQVKIWRAKKLSQLSFVVNSSTVKCRKHEWEFKLVGIAWRREANPHERGQDYRNGSLYDYSYRDGNLRKPDVNCGNQSWEAASVVLRAETFTASYKHRCSELSGI